MAVLRERRDVLIRGAATSVGHLVSHSAAWKNCTAFATTFDDDLDFAGSPGAETAINFKVKTFSRQRYAYRPFLGLYLVDGRGDQSGSSRNLLPIADAALRRDPYAISTQHIDEIKLPRRAEPIADGDDGERRIRLTGRVPDRH